MAVIRAWPDKGTFTPAPPETLKLKRTNFKDSEEPGGAHDGINLHPFPRRSGLTVPIRILHQGGVIRFWLFPVLPLPSHSYPSFGLLDQGFHLSIMQVSDGLVSCSPKACHSRTGK